jgi:hypothetical protein
MPRRADGSFPLAFVGGSQHNIALSLARQTSRARVLAAGHGASLADTVLRRATILQVRNSRPLGSM